MPLRTSPTEAAAETQDATPSGSATGAGSGREGLLAAARAELAEHGHAAISLRAVARRAGVSHAAPKYHFPDRAALLTAVATEGFVALAAAVERAGAAGGPGTGDDAFGAGRQLAAQGRAYIDFGLSNPALFDLMFRPSELHVDDPALQRARREAARLLDSTAERLIPSGPESSDRSPFALISWALVHGLVVLARDGALAGAAGSTDLPAAAELARGLAEAFTDLITRTGDQRTDART